MKIPIFPGTLPETNSLPLKMDGWNTTFLLGSRPIFRGKLAVSFRECNDLKKKKAPQHLAEGPGTDVHLPYPTPLKNTLLVRLMQKLWTV